MPRVENHTGRCASAKTPTAEQSKSGRRNSISCREDRVVIVLEANQQQMRCDGHLVEIKVPITVRATDIGTFCPEIIFPAPHDEGSLRLCTTSGLSRSRTG